MAIKLEDVSDDEIEEFGPGEIVFTKGEEADDMYLVLEGEVALKSGTTVIATAKEGDLVGEMSFLDRQPRSALAEAVGDVRLLPVNQGRFEELVRKHPEFGVTMLRTMARRLREMNAAVGGIPAPDASRASDSTSRIMLAMKGQAPFPAGSVIFKEGDKGDQMYFVASGTVDLRVGGKTVQTVEMGAFFGEMAVLEEAPRSASAHAVEDSKLMPVDKTKLDYLLTRAPGFAIEMMREIASRVRKMHKK